MFSYKYLDDIPIGTNLVLDNQFIYIVDKPVTIKGKITSNTVNYIYIVNGPYNADIKKRSYLWIAPEGSIEANKTLYIFGVDKLDNDDYAVSSEGNNGGLVVSGGQQNYTPNHPYLKNFPARIVSTPPIPKISGFLYLGYLGSNEVIIEGESSFCSPYTAFIGLEEDEIKDFNFICFNLVNRNSITFFNSKMTFNNFYGLAFDSVRVLCINDDSDIKFKFSLNILNQFVKRSNNVLGLIDSKLEIIPNCTVGLNAVFLDSYNSDETILITGKDEYIFKVLVFEDFYVRGVINSQGCIFSS